ncbi:MAG: family 78 glycoside hydrolase catalytic domain [Clostridia bacterium]|nr:family 78 glycoside hydrolase catalytic domain [Clostridia bacterium]
MSSFTSFADVRPIVDRNDRFTFRARWIQNPLFYRLGFRENRPATRDPSLGSELHNIHTLYRREVPLRGRVASAILRITADDTVRLYLNGELAVTGPAQSWPCHYYYQIYDVTEALNRCPGFLVLSAHVYYFGEYGFSYVSADNMEGLLLQLDIRYEDGSRERVVTDSSWKYLTCQAWRGERLYGYSTQFSEEITQALIPAGWRLPGFDDSAWDNAVVRGVPCPMAYELFPQPTPPLSLGTAYPENVSVLPDGAVLLDFGREIVGCTQILCTGNEGPIRVRHGEELLPDGHVRYTIRANCVYEDVILPDGRYEAVGLFDYKGFRWVEIAAPFVYTDGCVRVMTMNYPFRQSGFMDCSDRSFTDIWRICRNGVEVGTQDTYFDCPTREKGGFIGDAYITAFSHLLLTGDARILRKFLLDISASLRMDSEQTDVVPSYITGGLTDYALLIPSLIRRYYLQTGDTDTVTSLLPVLDALDENMRRFEDADGLLTAPASRLNGGEKTTLIDWPQNLRGDYDFAAAEGSASSVLNHLYYGFLRASAALYELCGETETADKDRQRAGRLAAVMSRRMYDPARRLFTDCPGSESCTLHGNAPALCYGVPFPDGIDAAVTLIKERGLRCGVYFAYYVLRSLYRAGRCEDAWTLMNNDGEYGWKAMLRAGATTCMEVWSPEQKWNTSLCHPWSSSPVIFWAEEVCGLTAGAPGWEILSFAPRIPTPLASGSVTVPIPAVDGRKPEVISLRFERSADQISFALTLPRRMTVRVSFLTDAVLIDGKQTGLPRGMRDGLTVFESEIDLEAGTHTFLT